MTALLMQSQIVASLHLPVIYGVGRQKLVNESTV